MSYAPPGGKGEYGRVYRFLGGTINALPPWVP